ncbi:MAG: hypothetical protein M5U28_49915 [Sandaracinaceae bacterium]|nr:hypothetical protein [Sandaracinaceae bacterium]
MAELGQAREEAPEEADRLRQELAEAEQRVEQLQEQLVRAEGGGDGRTSCASARSSRRRSTSRRPRWPGEAEEAEQLAREHNIEAERAQQQLQQGEQIGDVEAEVETRTQVEPAEGAQVEEQRVERRIGVERTYVDEGTAQQQQPAQQEPQPGAS